MLHADNPLYSIHIYFAPVFLPFLGFLFFLACLGAEITTVVASSSSSPPSSASAAPSVSAELASTPLLLLACSCSFAANSSRGRFLFLFFFAFLLRLLDSSAISSFDLLLESSILVPAAGSAAYTGSATESEVFRFTLFTFAQPRGTWASTPASAAAALAATCAAECHPRATRTDTQGPAPVTAQNVESRAAATRCGRLSVRVTFTGTGSRLAR
mmetsp:Transcript_14651/g.22960  ORF Transcript_14651/g.22960 Transcript_14651/m.22960 type:complete len:214 (+) Transcript_14651:93-734(+)